MIYPQNATEIIAKLNLQHQQASGEWIGLCPSHNDTRPSLVVSRGEDAKLLLHCRAGCTVQQITSEIGITMSDLFDVTFPSDFGDIVQSHREPLSDVAKTILDAKVNMLHANFRSHDCVQTQFGINAETAKRLMLGTDPSGTYVSVPFRDPAGKIIGLQQRCIDDSGTRWVSETNPADGGSWSRIGYFEGSDSDLILVCEGPSDAIAAVAAGYSAIAIRGASMVSDEIVSTIIEWSAGRSIVLCGDGDAAGRVFNDSLTSLLQAQKSSVHIIDLNEGSDLRSILIGDSVEALQRIIRNRQPAFVTPERDPNRFQPTDVGNTLLAVYLCSTLKDPLRFVPNMGWFCYHEGAWVPDVANFHRIILRAVGRSTRALVERLEADLNAVSMELGAAEGQRKAANQRSIELDDISTQVAALRIRKSSLGSSLREWKSCLHTCESTKGLNSMLKELQSEPTISTPVELFDTHDDLLLTANGVVNLQTGNITPFDPDLLITQKVNVAYNPEATAPRWDRFLLEVMRNDQEMADFLRRLTGYACTGHTIEQCFVIHYGLGSNGKSVFLDTLAGLFSGIYQQAEMQTFLKRDNSSSSNGIAKLRGARLVTASEGNANDRMGEALLKQVTGDANVTARFLFKEYITFTPKFLLSIASNHKPRFISADDGLWRRVKLVKWGRKFTADEQDRTLMKTLRTEYEGILVWAIRGAIEWNANGLQDPEPIVNAVREYRETSDALFGLLPGLYEISDEDVEPIKAKDVYQDYLDFSMSEGNDHAFKIRMFYSMLEERGVKTETTKFGKSVINLVKVIPPVVTGAQKHDFTKKGPINILEGAST